MTPKRTTPQLRITVKMPGWLFSDGKDLNETFLVYPGDSIAIYDAAHAEIVTIETESVKA